MNYRTIKLKRYTDIVNEYKAASSILPGSLLEVTAENQVRNNSTESAQAETLVALEDELQGRTTRQSYESGERVSTWYITPGEEALMLVDQETVVTTGELLESAGNGMLQSHGEGTALFVATGEKLIDNEGNHRVPVRRL